MFNSVMSFISAQSIPLIIAVAGVLSAFFQYQRAKEDARNFRQQLISNLHHAEGIFSALQTIGGSNTSYSSVDDVKNAVNATMWDAQSLFFGLVESKVGGVPLKDDLDKKYREWADLELERKMLGLKNWLAANAVPANSQTVIEPSNSNQLEPQSTASTTKS